MSEPLKIGLYRNHKGDLYEVLAVATEATNARAGGEVVVYLSIEEGEVYVRDRDEFEDTVLPSPHTPHLTEPTPRFKCVETDAPEIARRMAIKAALRETAERMIERFPESIPTVMAALEGLRQSAAERLLYEKRLEKGEKPPEPTLCRRCGFREWRGDHCDHCGARGLP